MHSPYLQKLFQIHKRWPHIEQQTLVAGTRTLGAKIQDHPGLTTEQTPRTHSYTNAYKKYTNTQDAKYAKHTRNMWKRRNAFAKSELHSTRV